MQRDEKPNYGYEHAKPKNFFRWIATKFYAIYSYA